MAKTSEADQIADVTRRLSDKYPDLPADLVETVVRENHQRFAGGSIRDYIPVLVEQAARRQLGTQTRKN